MRTTSRRYYWDPAIWGDIPAQAWHRPRPPQPTTHAGSMPISNTPCATCHRPLAQVLVDEGETHHINCGPHHTPMAHSTMPIHEIKR